MIKQLSRLRSQSGDTIVEVLIAMAVVSTVLVGAFIVTQKSAQAVQTSQEHSEALQIVQGQVEQVRALALKQTNTTSGVYTAGNFCINPATPAAPAVVPDSTCRNYQSRYNLSEHYDTTGGTNVFVFTAIWDSLNGGTNNVRLVYRIYPGIASLAAAAVTPNPAPASAPGLPAPPVKTPVPTPPPPPPPPVPTPSPAPASGGGGIDAAALPTNGGTKSCWQQYGWLDQRCWLSQIVNNSNNPNGSLSSCTFRWGDNNNVTYDGSAAQCQQGAVVSHQYTPVGTPENYIYWTITIENVSKANNAKTSNVINNRTPF